MRPRLTADQIRELAQAVQQLNGEHDRPDTKAACIQVLANRLGVTCGTISSRLLVLRLQVTPAKRNRRSEWRIDFHGY